MNECFVIVSGTQDQMTDSQVVNGRAAMLQTVEQLEDMGMFCIVYSLNQSPFYSTE